MRSHITATWDVSKTLEYKCWNLIVSNPYNCLTLETYAGIDQILSNDAVIPCRDNFYHLHRLLKVIPRVIPVITKIMLTPLLVLANYNNPKGSIYAR